LQSKPWAFVRLHLPDAPSLVRTLSRKAEILEMLLKVDRAVARIVVDEDIAQVLVNEGVEASTKNVTLERIEKYEIVLWPPKEQITRLQQ